MINERKNQSHNLIFKKSKMIEKKLLDHKYYNNAKNILFYVSHENEVYTHDLIKDILEYGKKTVYVPISDIEEKKLQISHLSSWNELILGGYSILEPRRGKQKIVSFNCIDLIIVPGIAFDKKGNRLGHGEGYYDWLIGKLPNANTIGLAFSFQIVNELPIESYDKKVRTIITDSEIIECLSN
jgi:5-formyltetrahydrofolate cyclo-ligase